jgi:cellulose synthase/poly-beta-1,6-N-acetylglucosamine synthase-like glycosyltransferase
MTLVSIIVPCYNEQATIQLMLEAVYNQDYPISEMEVVIADGNSSDQTRAKIKEFQERHPDLNILIVDNPRRIIPSGLNIAIWAAKGEILVRLDGHSVPSSNYISRCVENLSAGKGDNVGGIWRIQPRNPGWQAVSISLAAAHPLGVGDARYRIGGNAQEVDTVPFGSFYKERIKRLGGYNESLLTNEDYELNVRMRKNGGKIWFDPEIQSRYYAPPNFVSLARQYTRYGFWKVRMLALHPETLRWRQALPPVFVLSLLVLAAAGFFVASFWWLLVLELGCYVLLLLFSSLRIAMKERKWFLIGGLPLAIMTMHLCWGSAFLWSLVRIRKIKHV